MRTNTALGSRHMHPLLTNILLCTLHKNFNIHKNRLHGLHNMRYALRPSRARTRPAAVQLHGAACDIHTIRKSFESLDKAHAPPRGPHGQTSSRSEVLTARVRGPHGDDRGGPQSTEEARVGLRGAPRALAPCLCHPGDGGVELLPHLLLEGCQYAWIFAEHNALCMYWHEGLNSMCSTESWELCTHNELRVS